VWVPAEASTPVIATNNLGIGGRCCGSRGSWCGSRGSWCGSISRRRSGVVPLFACLRNLGVTLTPIIRKQKKSPDYDSGGNGQCNNSGGTRFGGCICAIAIVVTGSVAISKSSGLVWRICSRAISIVISKWIVISKICHFRLPFTNVYEMSGGSHNSELHTNHRKSGLAHPSQQTKAIWISSQLLRAFL
jgi:hypothetical protein